MKESVILQSPHAVDPLKCLTEEEKEERYRTRLDEIYRPYTVIDVLTSVYHRCFEDDLCNYAGEHPEEVIAPESGWGVSRVWVNECRICRVETLFFQPLSDFAVELLVHASLRGDCAQRKRQYEAVQEYPAGSSSAVQLRSAPLQVDLPVRKGGRSGRRKSAGVESNGTPCG